MGRAAGHWLPPGAWQACVGNPEFTPGEPVWDSRRGWRLDRPSLDTLNDSIIALCMALDALEDQPEPVQLVGWL